MKVFTYFNLHKKVWSIKALEGEKKGLVVKHTKGHVIKNAIFKVSEAGRKRVLRDKVKNVHAGVVGEFLEDAPEGVSLAGATPVTYNPYVTGSFVNKETGAPVESAEWVLFLEKSVYAKGLVYA